MKNLSKKKKKWIKIKKRRARKEKKWFSYKPYWRYLFKQDYSNYKNNFLPKKKRFKKRKTRYLSRVIFGKKRKKKLFFFRFKRLYWFRRRRKKYLIYRNWQESKKYFSSRKRYFFLLENIKKYYDCFYILNQFFNWYSSKKNLNFNNIYSYSQYKKYYGYNKLYNSYFEFNYKNILSVMKCYLTSTFSKHKILNNNNIRKFLYRQKKLYKLNFFYRIFTNKKKIKNYHYYLNKKFFFLNKNSFYNKLNYLSSSYANDISLLFNDHIINWSYLSKIDEKMYFYMKHLLFYNVFKGFKKKFNVKINFNNTDKSLLLNHLVSFHSKYLIFYRNLYFCLSLNLLTNNSLKQIIFFDYNICKFNVFILKKKFFFFFKDYLIHQLKSFIYSSKFNKYYFSKTFDNATKRLIKKKVVDSKIIFYKNKNYFVETEKKKDLDTDKYLTSWLKNHFSHYTKNKAGTSYYGLRDISYIVHYFILNNFNFFFNLNYSDFIYFVFNVYKKKKIDYFFSYKYLYKKKFKSSKKKMILNYVSKFLYKKDTYKNFNFTDTISFLRFKNNYFNTFLKQKDKLNFIKIYKKHLYFILKKHLGKKKEFFKNKKKKKIILNNLFLNKKKNMTVNFRSFFNLLFSKKKKLNNNYYLNKYFDVFNDVYKFNNKNKLSNKKNKKFISLWNNYIKNKKIIIFFISNIVKYLYTLKNKNTTVNYSKINFFYTLSSITNFFILKEKHFNYFYNLNKYYSDSKVITNNKKKKIISFTNNKSYVLNRKRKNIFFISSHYNIFMVFFFYFKKCVLEKSINNSFTIYKNKILFYSFKNNFIFMKNKYYQFDYFIKDFLNQEIETLIK